MGILRDGAGIYASREHSPDGTRLLRMGDAVLIDEAWWTPLRPLADVIVPGGEPTRATIRQAVGEMGAVDEDLPPVRNWVEPDPVPFERLSATAMLTADGLAARDLLTKDSRKLLGDYIRFVDRLAAIAADELAGQPISEQDNEWLRAIGGPLEGFWWRTGDKLNTARPIRDAAAAIIADIMRGIDLQAGTDEVVEIGTGRIDRIFVIVPDDAVPSTSPRAGSARTTSSPGRRKTASPTKPGGRCCARARRPTGLPGRLCCSRNSSSHWIRRSPPSL